MIASIPATLRLDNAANIYPASMSKHYSSLYRMKVSLTDPIDISILQEALLSVSERIPTFRCTLKAGAFWWYLKRINATPSILPLTPLRHPDFKEQKGLLYRVSAEDASIYLDVFHALADGNGALCFLLTLTGEYIRLKYGASIRYNRLVLDPKLRPAYFEVEDSFKTVFSGRHGQLEQNVDAYHIRGHALPHAAVRDLRAVIQMDQIQAVCKRFACTVTELLTAAMLWALQEEHRKDPSEKKRSVLKVSVPVNLRPLYDSRTVRNFSSYVNLGVDIKDGYLSFEQLVSAVKAQKAHDLQKEHLEPKIAANVELEAPGPQAPHHRHHQPAARRPLLLPDPLQHGPCAASGNHDALCKGPGLHPGPPAGQQRRLLLCGLQREALPPHDPQNRKERL